MHNKNSFEETREEIPTAVLPVDHPDVVAISEHIQAAKSIRSLIDSESSHGGQTIKDAIDALRSDDASNSSMPPDGTDDAGAQA